MYWNKITLVGVGLLGGSLGSALRQRGLAGSVMGYVRREASVAESLAAGAVDQATCDLNAAVQGADLVVLCTPIAQMSGLVRNLLPALKAGAVVTDVGSVKGTVVDEIEPLVASAGAHFVGSHPMAGSEKAGVQAARPDLFSNALCVITPTPGSHTAAVAVVEALWRSVGARLMSLAPEVHDALVSRSSHVVHIVAAQLANYVLDPAQPKEQRELCANGFRDTTRIASSSPEMWRDIALANRANLAQALAEYVAELGVFQRALLEGDGAAVTDFFAQARLRRDIWATGPGSPSPE